MVLLVLAAIWAAVLLPPYLQKRRAFHPSSSVVDFRHQLSVLERTGDPLAPRTARSLPRHTISRAEVQRRRRDVLATLTAAAVLTFLLAVVAGGVTWLLHLAVDAALLGYVALLMQVQQQRTVAQHGARRHAAVRPAAPRHAMAFDAHGQHLADVVEIDVDRRPSATQQALLRRRAN